MAANETVPVVSVVIPLLDEEGSLVELCESLERVLKLMGSAYEVIFIDDGSTDGSARVLDEQTRRFPSMTVVQLRKNFGKSTALDVGFKLARGRFIVTLDADLQDDPDEIPNLLAELDKGFDLVVGWKTKRQDPWHKILPSKLFNFVTSTVARIRLHDFNCGLKAYRREVIENIQLYGQLHRYIPALACWKGFRVTEIPVRHHPRKYGQSKFGAARYFHGFYDLLTVAFITKYAGRPMHFFGKIGLALIMAGFGICAYLTVLKIRGAFIALRPLLTLGVLLLIVGVLFLSTGLLGEMILYLFRSRERRIAGHLIKFTTVGKS